MDRVGNKEYLRNISVVLEIKVWPKNMAMSPERNNMYKGECEIVEQISSSDDKTKY